MDLMNIEVWSDFVCPFCYIGKRTLENTLDTFEHKDQVNVTYKSYELDPQARNETDVSYTESLAKNKGMSLDQVNQMLASVTERAKEVGLDYNFDIMKQSNTFDAHRLMKYAETQGKGNEYNERLLKAHFEEGQQVGDHDTLVQLASEVGLDEEASREVLESEQFTKEVRLDQAEAHQIGVQGVPFFVVDRKYGISGAQPEEVFTQALNQIWEEDHQTTPLQTFGSQADGMTCTDDGCEIPGSNN